MLWGEDLYIPATGTILPFFFTFNLLSSSQMASDGQFMALQSVHKLLGNKYAFNDGLVTVIYQIHLP